MKANIVGHDYNIEFVDGLYINEGEWGIHKPNLLEIIIDNDLKDSVKGECLHHEMLEALNFWQNWVLEHHLLTQISSNIFGTLNSNPELLSKLYGISNVK